MPIDDRLNEVKSYIKLAGDEGRSPTPTPTPIWIWLLIAAMVSVVAAGFLNYAFAGWIIPSLSENLKLMYVLGIAFVIPVTIAQLTHLAGQELYLSGEIKEAKRQWLLDASKTSTSARAISLIDPQSIDEDQPEYIRCINRIAPYMEYRASYKLTIFAFIVVIWVTTSLIYMHLQVPATNQVFNVGYDMFPAFILMILTLSWVGVLSGYKWGFTGRHSKHAYKLIQSTKLPEKNSGISNSSETF